MGCNDFIRPSPHTSTILEIRRCFSKPWLYPDWIYMNFSRRGRQFKKACRYVHSVSDDIIHKRREALVRRSVTTSSSSSSSSWRRSHRQAVLRSNTRVPLWLCILFQYSSGCPSVCCSNDKGCMVGLL